MSNSRCLSLPGCAINDDVLQVLAPALVRIQVGNVNWDLWSSSRHFIFFVNYVWAQ
jgi:hypothetical protein